ncbi:AraC family transcriptional regulator [Macrococcoides caseolyticum]|uniref:AraC family transcriptional regulator n=1 Tax=Macrococcoides caseolyticum TaxID=69966 RepID=UPI001F4250C2|nr:AraC family transcriptional regulator [Macrococcus caseolyticus]MCE4956633.1 helix-turn-helix transcriptional regulator [Macrococcus caseolyticus]
MKYDAVSIMQENAIHLAGIQLNEIKLNQMNKLKRSLSTPFTNTRSKQYQENVETFVQVMRPQVIYHYKNHFDVQYLMFKHKSEQSIIIIGPFLENRPSEKTCHEMLQSSNLPLSKLLSLKQYLLQIPLCQYKKALTLCRLATKFITGKKQLFDIEAIAFKFHRVIEETSHQKYQYEYELSLVEHRYNIENQLLIAIEKGDIEMAYQLLAEIQLLVSGLQRAKNDINNARYKTNILNVLSRKALEKAGANVLVIDEISARYARKIDDTIDSSQMDDIAKALVLEYTELANRAHALNHSPIVTKVIQYIELNLDKSLTLQELADYAKVSKTYLSKVFNTETKQSLTDYINHMRIKKSIELLERTAMPLSDIYSYVGFKSQSYFSKCFKTYTGQTPLQFKKQIGKM